MKTIIDIILVAIVIIILAIIANAISYRYNGAPFIRYYTTEPAGTAQGVYLQTNGSILVPQNQPTYYYQ